MGRHRAGTRNGREDIGKSLALYPPVVIFDGENGGVPRSLEAPSNATEGGRVLASVIEQVSNDLSKPHDIDVRVQRCIRHVHIELMSGASFPPEARLPGPDPKRTSYGSFFSFSDPDGNTWLVQEVTTRHPGRV